MIWGIDLMLALQALGYAVALIAAVVTVICLMAWAWKSDRGWIFGVFLLILLLTVIFYDGLRSRG